MWCRDMRPILLHRRSCWSSWRGCCHPADAPCRVCWCSGSRPFSLCHAGHAGRHATRRRKAESVPGRRGPCHTARAAAVVVAYDGSVQATRALHMFRALGTVDVELIPKASHGRAVTVNMFSGLVYTVDPTDGSAVQSFDCEDIVPHIDVPGGDQGGMVQLLAMPKSGDRLI